MVHLNDASRLLKPGAEVGKSVGSGTSEERKSIQRDIHERARLSHEHDANVTEFKPTLYYITAVSSVPTTLVPHTLSSRGNIARLVHNLFASGPLAPT